MFIRNQETFQRKFVSPITFILSDVISGNITDINVLINVIVIFMSLVGLIFLFVNKKTPLSYKFFTLLIMFVSTSTVFLGDNQSYYTIGYMRYILPALPLFIETSRMKKIWKILFIEFMVLMLFVISISFYYKHFIA